MIFTIGQIAGLLSFAAYLFYILSIIKGETKPARSTWFIQLFVGLIILVSYKSSGAEDTIWVVLGDFIGVFCIAILSIKYGVGGKSKIDIFSFIFSIIALILWWLFKNPAVALLASLLIDFISAIPTIVKTYKEPELEDKFAWTITTLANILSIFAIEKWVFIIALYPIYTSIIDGIVWILILLPGKNNKKI